MLHHQPITQQDVPSAHPRPHANDEPVTDQHVPVPFLTRMPYRLLPYSQKNLHLSTSPPGGLTGSRLLHPFPAISLEDREMRQHSTQQHRILSDCATTSVAIPRPLASSAVHTPIPVLSTTILRHLSFVLKVLSITLVFLLDLPIEFILLAHTPTFQLVDIVVVLVLYSNVIKITIQRHYYLTLDLLKTTLHLKSIKLAEPSAPRVHLSTFEHLKRLEDTTAYLQALKVAFVKKEQSR